MTLRTTTISRLAAVLLAGATAWTSADAAPATDADPSPPPAATRPIPAPRGADAAQGPRTVDILTDLQSRSAGLEFNERARAADDRPLRIRQAPADKAPGAGGETTIATPPALYGAGAAPMVQQRRPQSGSDSAWNGSGGAVVGGSGQAGAPSALPAWMLLPRDLVLWVREHRVLVGVGLAAGLALTWAASMGLARRRH